MEKRATQKEKEEYKITTNLDGNWEGKCPECSIQCIASNGLVSQSQVIKDIRKHQRLIHGNKHYTSEGNTVSLVKPQCKVWGCMNLEFMPEVGMCRVHRNRVRDHGGPFNYYAIHRKQGSIDEEKRRATTIMNVVYNDFIKHLKERNWTVTSLKAGTAYHIVSPNGIEDFFLQKNLTSRREFLETRERVAIAKLGVNPYTGEQIEPVVHDITPEPIIPDAEFVEEVEKIKEIQMPLEDQHSINTSTLATIETMMGFIAEMAGQINDLKKKVDELERKMSRSNPLADLKELISG